MVESSQPQNRPEIEEVSGITHLGFGDINVIALSLGRAIKLLKQSGQNEEAVALERFIAALKQLDEYQQMVNELSRVISMLLDLEFALVTVVPTIRNTVVRRRVDFDYIETTWTGAIWPPIRKLSYFVSNEVEVLKKPHFEANPGKVTVSSMITELIALQQSFVDSLKEQNTKEMYALSKNMYDTCREHLFKVSQQLERMTNQLVLLSNQVLMRIDNA